MGMPNPFAGFPVTDDWAAHRARGSLGGTDYGTPVGTPIVAPNPGFVSYEAGNGSGGYIISLALGNSPGYVMQFLHCSAFEGGNRNVNEGDILGYTGGAKGAPGAGSSTGTHVHVHLVDPNGVREDVQPWFADVAPTSGGSAPASASVDYSEVQSLLAARGYYGGAIDGEFGRQSWTAVQTLCADFGFMDASYIDGVPGKKTYTGMQLYAQKNDNYRSKVDGVVGPLTWAGFVQSLREDAPKPAPVPIPPAPVVEPTPVPPAVKPVKPVPAKPQNPKPTRPVTPKPKEEKPMADKLAAQKELASGLQVNDLGSIITDARTRKIVWAVWTAFGLLLAGTMGGFAAVQQVAPDWIVFAMGVSLALQPAFGSLAMANITSKK